MSTLLSWTAESNNDVEGSKAKVRLEGGGSFQGSGCPGDPGGKSMDLPAVGSRLSCQWQEEGAMDPIFCRGYIVICHRLLLGVSVTVI